MLTHNLGDERGSNVYRSTDQGKSFERIGQVRIPGTRVDEQPDLLGLSQSDSCLQSADSLLAANIVSLQSVCIVHTMRQRPTL